MPRRGREGGSLPGGRVDDRATLTGELGELVAVELLLRLAHGGPQVGKLRDLGCVLPREEVDRPRGGGGFAQLRDSLGQFGLRRVLDVFGAGVARGRELGLGEPVELVGDLREGLLGQGFRLALRAF